jgi:hypothetical protein
MVAYSGSGLLSCIVVLEVVEMGDMILDLLLLRMLVSVSMNDIAIAVVYAAIIVICIRVVAIETQGQQGTNEIGGEELSLIKGRLV